MRVTTTTKPGSLARRVTIVVGIFLVTASTVLLPSLRHAFGQTVQTQPTTTPVKSSPTSAVDCSDKTASAESQPAPTSSSAPNVKEGSVSYYTANCSTCHGSAARAYGNVPLSVSGEDLRQTILTMAEGPAQAPLDKGDLEEQVKLHEAFRSGDAYVWITTNDDGSKHGETIPGTKIFASTTGKEEAELPATNGRFNLPADVSRITVRRGEVSRTVTP